METSVEEVVVEGFAVKDPGALPTTPAFPRRCTAAANATECSVSVRDELASLPTPPSSELAGAEVAASVEEEPALPALAARGKTAQQMRKQGIVRSHTLQING